jgi:hypothetical protein
VSWCSAVMESCRGEVLVNSKTNNLNSQFLFIRFYQVDILFSQVIILL